MSSLKLVDKGAMREPWELIIVDVGNGKSFDRKQSKQASRGRIGAAVIFVEVTYTLIITMTIMLRLPLYLMAIV